MVTIDNNTITYHIDGRHFGTHGAAYLPERPMSINFNQWLIDLASRTSATPCSYGQQVGYVPHLKDQVLGPAQVGTPVNGYRAAGTTFEDTVPAVRRSVSKAGPAHSQRSLSVGLLSA